MNHQLKGRNQFIYVLHYTDTTLTSSKGNKVHSRCTKRPMTKFRFLSVRFGSTWLFDLRFFTDTVSDQTRFYLQQNKQVIQQFKQSVHLCIESLVHDANDVLGYLYILFVHVHICTDVGKMSLVQLVLQKCD